MTSCSNTRLKKANREYDHKHYQKAIVHYNKILANKRVNIAQVNLANSYYYTNDIVNAKHYYNDAIHFKQSGNIEYLNYARILMQEENYKEAKFWLKKVLSTDSKHLEAKVLFASCNSINDFYRDTTLFELKETKIEGFKNVFGQTEYMGGVVFSADKNVVFNSKKSSWTGNSYLDLYFTEKDESGRWLDPEILKGDINGKYHEGPADFTKDGKTAYFTRNNYKKRKLNDKSVGENNLKIYMARLIDGKWKNIEELPFNSDLYSTGHPALSEDEK